MILTRTFLVVAALSGGLAVAGGAFAAHGLSASLSQRSMEIFETGVRYQMYHALALVLVALFLTHSAARLPLAIAGSAFILGIILFSGSLYGLSLSDIKWLGMITPLGGVALMVGWGCLAIAAFSFKVP